MQFSRNCDWTLLITHAISYVIKTWNEMFRESLMEDTMKTWTKPAVREQEVGLEVTSYLPAEIDLI
jgi:coenzyme PQQ precursor peptide PqqA